jgi:hypothetical protein
MLLRKLPRDLKDKIELHDEVSLQYYRVQKIFEGSISLEQGNPLPNDKHAGKGKKDEEKVPLSELVEKLNDRFGTDFSKEDMLVVEQFVADMENDNDLRTQAQNNSVEHFKFPFNDAFMGVVVDRMAQNKAFCERILDDDTFGGVVKDLLVGYVYDRLRAQV